MNETLLGLIARHFLTIAAGWLVSSGLLQSDQKGAFVQIGAGLVAGALGLLWSWWKNTGQAQVAALLRHVTRTQSTTAAVEIAKALPAGSAVTKGLP